MQNQLDYAPSGTVEEVHATLWTVATKQAFPIQGPFYNIAGYLFKPTLNRLDPTGPLDLEIELMSPVSTQMPLQVGVTIETMAPPGEKKLTHSFQRQSAALSDRNRALRFKMVMMHDRWENSKGLRIEFKFDSIQRQKPRYDWLWNSQSTKDVEIRFQDPQVAPVFVHKDYILEACPKFINLVQVVNSAKKAAGNDGASDAMTQDQGHTPPSTRSSRPDSPTPNSSPVLTSHTSPNAREQRQQQRLQPSGQGPDLMSLDEGSDASSFYPSRANSFVNLSRDWSVFSSSMDDLSTTGSDRSQHESPRHSKETLFKDADAGECQSLLSQIRSDSDGSQYRGQQQSQGSNGGVDSDQIQQLQGDQQLSRNEKKGKKKLARKQQSAAAAAAAASENMPSAHTKNAMGENDERKRKMEIFTLEQAAKRQTQQQEREISPHSPLTHISPGSKTPPSPVSHQHQMQHLQLWQSPSPQTSTPDKSVPTRPKREIWQWPANLHADVCTILTRWIYLEELPSHWSESGFPLDVVEILLDTFYHLNLQTLFQRFLITQLLLVEQHQNPMSFWKFPELAEQGGMVHRFFRPVIIRTSAQNLRKIVYSQEFGDILESEDPSGIFREAFAAQPSSLSRQ